MDRIQEYPIIAAVKNDDELEVALASECTTIFLLYGSLLNIRELIQAVKKTGKCAIVHIDLIEGLSGKEVVVDFLSKFCKPDGIISTKCTLIHRAKQFGMITIQRVFILDSLAVRNINTLLEAGHPDYVEILPGLMPRVVKDICNSTDIPIITGGLIKTRDEVIQALNAGATAVSSTCCEVWKL